MSSMCTVCVFSRCGETSGMFRARAAWRQPASGPNQACCRPREGVEGERGVAEFQHGALATGFGSGGRSPAGGQGWKRTYSLAARRVRASRAVGAAACARSVADGGPVRHLARRGRAPASFRRLREETECFARGSPGSSPGTFQVVQPTEGTRIQASPSFAGEVIRSCCWSH